MLYKISVFISSIALLIFAGAYFYKSTKVPLTPAKDAQIKTPTPVVTVGGTNAFNPKSTQEILQKAAKDFITINGYAPTNTITISAIINDKYMRGIIADPSKGKPSGEALSIYGANTPSGWVFSVAGHGPVECSFAEKYQLPKKLIGFCYDSTKSVTKDSEYAY